MTNCTGRPPPVPGSVGGAKTKACTPATSSMRVLHVLLDRRLAAVALAPGHQPEAGEGGVGAAEADDREARRSTSGDVLGRLGHVLSTNSFGVVGGRVGRRVHDREHEADVLLRRELARRVEEQEDHRRRERGDDHQRHRPVVERGGDAPAVPVADAVEAAVDDPLEAARRRRRAASARAPPSSARASARRSRR